MMKRDTAYTQHTFHKMVLNNRVLITCIMTFVRQLVDGHILT